VAALAAAVAFASTLAWTVAVGLAISYLIGATPSARRRRARNASRQWRRVRRARHAARLDRANAPTYEYVELADVVDNIAELDEGATAELEPLLERYIDVALARQRCATALEQSKPSHLEVQLAIASECHPREAAVLERRIAHSRRLAQRLARFDDSVAEVADLVRYYAERASLPEIEPVLEGETLATALASYDACEQLDRS
jgi:hypothetical protein